LFVYSFGNLTVPDANLPPLLAAPSAVGELALCILLTLNRVRPTGSHLEDPARQPSRVAD
jgi:hypothetical protein